MLSSNKSDVSVIIPAYCAENHIERAINSVFKQTVLPDEIIVVDDGSTDQTWVILTKIAKKQNPTLLRILSQSHNGPGAARNLAIRNSNSKLIAFLDADDEWLPNKLEETMKYVVNYGYDLIAHNVIMVEGKNERKNNIAARYREASNSLFFGLYCKGFIGTSTVVTSLALIEEAGFFDETLSAGQDFDLWLKILGKKTSKFLVFDDYLTKNYIRSSSITRNVGNRLKCTLRIARRHAPKIRHLGGAPLKGLIFRVAAVYYEAFRGYLFNAQLFSALFNTLKFLPTLLLEIFYLISALIKEDKKKRV